LALTFLPGGLSVVIDQRATVLLVRHTRNETSDRRRKVISVAAFRAWNRLYSILADTSQGYLTMTVRVLICSSVCLCWCNALI